MLLRKWKENTLAQQLFLAGLFVCYILVDWQLGHVFLLRMLVETVCFALLALALSVQWGYAGLFNAGVMGFIAVGAYATLLTIPPNPLLWSSSYPLQLLALLALILSCVFGAKIWSKLPNITSRTKTTVSRLILGVGTVVCVLWFIRISSDIERDVGFIGGLGLHPFVAWTIGGLLAGAVGWGIGRICLGLRSDYLAIATLGIAEIIRTVFKNADWLTDGVRPTGPLPWPIPTSGEVGFAAARGGYLLIVLFLLAVVYYLVQHSYHSPWGRTMRAIRDNENAASAMGKYVDLKRLECFVIGAALMGFAGAVLINFTGTFNADGFTPLHHTFLIWVMVILGGAGNNFGTIIGAAIVYLFWSQSEAISLAVFHFFYQIANDLFAWPIPNDLDTKALQMRVFVLGLTIVTVLRYAPNGIFPERPPKYD